MGKGCAPLAARMMVEPITVTDLDCMQLRWASGARRRRARRLALVRAVMLAAGAAGLVVFGALLGLAAAAR